MSQHDLTIRTATDDDQKRWDLVVNHPLQSWAWGDFRTSMGIDVVRFVVEQNRKFVEGCQLTFHKIPHIPWTIGYFPKGPTITKTMLETLEKLGKEKRAIFIQLEPNSIGHWTLDIGHYGLRPSHHPLFTKYTFILNLTKSEEDLLKDMHPKTRYNLKVAQKHEVTIQEDNSDNAFETYLQLTHQTTQRQRFYAHGDVYHQHMWHHLKKSNIAHLFTAKYNNKVLAAWVIFAWKDTIYYPYGASSREHKDVMAPSLMLWEIARWGKYHGFKKFDLWGALGPPPVDGSNENDPWFGFHRFKQGFNPELVEFIGSYDLVLNPLLYCMYATADMIRWQILR